MPLAINQVIAGQPFQMDADYSMLDGATGFKSVVDGVEEGAMFWFLSPGTVRGNFAARPVGTYQAGIRAYGAGSSYSEVLMAVEVVAPAPPAPTNLRIVR